MMDQIILSGFGGQGVMFIGKVLAYAGMTGDLQVCWIPSYGPEMRGGTANVTVILSDSRISSPILQEFDTAIILNQQSLDKFKKSVKPGGVLIYDPNGITRHPVRKDIKVYQVDATEEALKMKNAKIFNMIVLGAFLKLKPIVKMENVIKGLKESLPPRHHHLIPLNEEAIKKGIEIVKQFSVN